MVTQASREVALAPSDLFARHSHSVLGRLGRLAEQDGTADHLLAAAHRRITSAFTSDAYQGVRAASTVRASQPEEGVGMPLLGRAPHPAQAQARPGGG